MLPENLFPLLDAWTGRGWLRSLDKTFVSFLSEQQPETPDLVLLAAALTSHQLGRGHICLDLNAALADPDGTLSLPPEGEVGEELPSKPSELLSDITQSDWEKYLLESALVATAEGNTPLVLSSGRLYLRRYWQHTQLVAQNVLARVGQNIPTPENLAEQLSKEGKRADVVIANNVLAHVPDLNGFVKGIKILLKDEGTAVLEVPYLINLIENTQFDTIYHQHLCYFSVTALDRLFRRHQLYINNIKVVPIHGGSLRLYIDKTQDVKQPLDVLLA